MKRIVVFTNTYLEKVSLKIKNIANGAISLDKNGCIKQNTLLKIRRSGECQGISQDSETFTTFKKPDQGDYLYILFMLSEQIPKGIFPWEEVLSNNDLVLTHNSNMNSFIDKGVNFIDFENSRCKDEKFSSKKGGSWPDFEKLVDSINTDEQRFQDALDTLFGISKEELLISMKILFLPAYLASKANESNVFINKDDCEQLTNTQTTKDGGELQKNWLLGSDDGIGQYFDADGKLIEEIPNFHAKYEELCQLS